MVWRCLGGDGHSLHLEAGGSHHGILQDVAIAVYDPGTLQRPVGTVPHRWLLSSTAIHRSAKAALDMSDVVQGATWL